MATFLTKRSGFWHYVRRVPDSVADFDGRGVVRLSTKIRVADDPRGVRARTVAAEINAEVESFWATATEGKLAEAKARFEAARRRASSLGFRYRTADDIAAGTSLDEIVKRIGAAFAASGSEAVMRATLGGVAVPSPTVTEAFAVYLGQITPDRTAGKSPAQRRKWENTKQASVDAFVSVIGDLQIGAITRDDARRFHEHFLKQIVHGTSDGDPKSASLGNRRLGDMRALFRDYFAHLGEPDRRNPFDGLAFVDKSRRSRKRPSFPHSWIVGRLLAPGALAGLNPEARGILLVVADIGCRPSEIANLTPEAIVLKHDVPHVRIEPRFDPDDPREIKTESSIRVVPLVGLALAVMKKHPAGFPRYKDKEASLSAVLNKFLKENNLLPTLKHSVYSLRHSFEDRMKESYVDSEMRNILMGHSIDRPEYGEGGSLRLRRAAMEKVTLPFDPSIV
jgi:integrase